MIITPLDIKETLIPKSLYSYDMEQDITAIVDKKLITDVTDKINCKKSERKGLNEAFKYVKESDVIVTWNL